jgi:hypothetical protein
MQMDIYDKASVVFAIRFAKISEFPTLENMNRAICVLKISVVAILRLPFVAILMRGVPFDL